MNRKSSLTIDWGIIVPVLILCIISLSSLASINIGLFRNQLFAIVLSFLAYLFFAQINFKVFRLYSPIIYIVSVIVLAIILFLGVESRGAVRWIYIFGISVQFSEILKPFLAFIFASFLANRTPSFKTTIYALLLITPVAGLITIQPDLGSGLVYIGVAVLTMLVYGTPLYLYGLGIAGVLISMPFVWNMLHDYQRQRVLTFIHPTSDPLGTSYNSIQAVIAVGSGMVLGKGFSQGTQSGLFFLPERHTDFIFATISEGLGLIGALIIIVTFMFLLYRIYRIYLDTNDAFCKIFATLTFFLLLIQFFVNIGMNVGILPIVGITLPFVSYGGSSLVSNFILLGLLTSISSVSKERKVLEIR